MEGYRHMVENGIAEESAYPYVGTTNSCKGGSTYFLQNFCVHEPKGSEDMLKLLLVKYGPMSILLGIVSSVIP